MCAFLFSFPRIHSGWLNWSQFSADIVVPSGPQPDTSVAQVSIVLNLRFSYASPFSHILGVAFVPGALSAAAFTEQVPRTPKSTHSPSSLWQTWTLCQFYGVILGSENLKTISSLSKLTLLSFASSLLMTSLPGTQTE